MELRVVTLNFWGLPGAWPIGSRDRSYRLAKLVEALLVDDYDVVALQEIWSENDYLKIADALKCRLPFVHYFHSGLIGSGVCILSRYPILSTLMHRYSLNGFVHHIHRGDWFGGKVVGMVQLLVGDYRVNFYSTHLHAEYGSENAFYLPHRISQAFELGQFVKHTSYSADLSILTGDLNLQSNDIGYRLLISNAKLRDVWDNREDDDIGATSDRPDNVYTYRGGSDDHPGIRIDYILYRSERDVNMEVIETDNRLNHISGIDEPMNYSDHVAVYAKFRISTARANEHKTTFESKKPLLAQSIKVVATGEKRAKCDRCLYIGIIVVMVMIFIASISIDVYYPSWAIVSMCTRFILTLLIAFCVWYGFIGLKMEEKALKAAKLSMAKLIKDKNT